ncbi:replication-relaxation family protein [Bradyrhizobium elkanii]
MRSTHIATLVGRSLDRTNDRLCRLYHAGYVDKPRAQLDYYPTSGSATMVYALGDLAIQFLAARGMDFANLEWSRKNREASRRSFSISWRSSTFTLRLSAPWGSAATSV